MSVFVSTFPSGLQEPAEAFLREDLPEAKVLDVYDGLIVYKAEPEYRKIKGLRYFNNSFLLLKKYAGYGSDSPEWMIREALKMKDLGKKLSDYRFPAHDRQFRIIASRENQLVPVSRDVLLRMERKIAGMPGFRVNRARPDLEFWFLSRREKVGFFLLRLTKHPSAEKDLHQGELRPELSHILCRLSDPGPGDIFLDPFCGYGAIPLERARMCPYRMIFLSDIGEEPVRFCRARAKELEKKSGKKLIVRRCDALHMVNYEDGFIDRVVTDPPWGMYQELDMDTTRFYQLALKELFRVLKPEGILVLLTARKGEFEHALTGFRGSFAVQKQYSILVSGKKASIYVIKKLYL